MRIAIVVLGLGIGLAGCLPSTELTVTKSGAGSGTVKSDPLGIDCGDTCTMHMNAEGVVELTATPAEGHTFRGWSGDCSGVEKCVIDSSFNGEVDARFEVVTPITVQMMGTPPNISVFSDPVGLVCTDGTCTGEFVRDTDVKLSLPPVPSLSFDGWTGACQGTDPTCIVHVGDEPIAAEVTFYRTFSLTLSATGSGTLVGANASASNGSGIAILREGSTVTLQAQRGSGSTIVTWSGDCANAAGDQCGLVMTGPRTAGVWFH